MLYIRSLNRVRDSRWQTSSCKRTSCKPTRIWRICPSMYMRSVNRHMFRSTPSSRKYRYTYYRIVSGWNQHIFFSSQDVPTQSWFYLCSKFSDWFHPDDVMWTSLLLKWINPPGQYKFYFISVCQVVSSKPIWSTSSSKYYLWQARIERKRAIRSFLSRSNFSRSVQKPSSLNIIGFSIKLNK